MCRDQPVIAQASQNSGHGLPSRTDKIREGLLRQADDAPAVLVDLALGEQHVVALLHEVAATQSAGPR